MKPKKRNEKSLTASSVGKWTTFTAVLVVLVGTASFGFGQTRSKSVPTKGNSSVSNKLSPELTAIINQLQGRSSNQRLSVIVQFKHSPSASQLQNLAVPGDSPRKFSLIRGGALTLTVNGIRVLAKNPEVAYISPNRSLKGSADYTEATVGADVAQSYGWDGAGVTVAVIDSGINNHPDLRDPATGLSRVIYNESFVPGTTPNDQYGHGTHVAGILAGNGTQSSGALNVVQRISGVAPSVQLVNLKVLDANGSGQDSYVIAALQRAIALKDTYNIRVVNLSLGRPVFESYTQDPVCQAVEAAWQAGLVVVVAAGNNGRKNDYGLQGYATISAPGNDPYVITVGAMNAKNSPNKADDVIATYSSKGPTLLDHVVKPDLVAPGNRIASLLVSKSTLDVKYPTNEVSAASYGGTLGAAKSYFFLSGTSMATPVVSGAVALMLEQDRTLTPDTVKARLMKTADKTFPVSSKLTVGGIAQTYQYDIFTVGAGYLNIPNALGNTDTVNGTALSPIAVHDDSGTVSLLADDSSVWSNSVVWGNSVIWGSSVIWGNALVSGTSVIWGNSVVWGNATLDGCSVIWGNSVIWGSSLGAADSGNDALSIDGGGDDDGEELP